MKRILFAALVALLLTAATSTVGRPFEAGNLSKLVVGETTIHDAERLLGGSPQHAVAGASGAIGYTWEYIESKVSLWSGKGAVKSQRVVLIFGTDGRFQRIFQLDGIVLPPEDHQRLFAGPKKAEPRT
ncbi:MAG: hypothetical protein WBG87_15060 [Stenotrophomonas maltophilia]